ncbi:MULTISPECIES: helix-turn-helix transcriptional regulator [Vibrio]|uniref:helix-turn-helix transcriptional regulator n=1 Tax=Vibrio TaxID=662 RepID=UPI0005F9D077|nr:MULTISPECIES: AraC family transcriptional regulator [Vibrio]KJY85912.1 AraC family transcriptional regulator [Vibrio neptunius]MDA0118066.1 AraC family transcriptional regulator [Vibrio sp. T11.5]NRB65964.1 helix-turn-helix transcriptional regulator [Vibrio sp.]
MQANDLILEFPEKQFITKTTAMSSGYVDDFHTHSWHQIIFPIEGLLQSDIGGKCVVVPHNGMLYIPANTVHKSIAITDTQFLAIYLNPDKFIQYGAQPKSCFVSPFIKELILVLFDNGTRAQSESNITHLLMVLQDQIALASCYEIPLLIPTDKRLLSIFVQLKQQPDLSFTLRDWATKVGASERTLSRLCAKEFAQSFAMWRRNIRLVLSLQLLSSNKSIQEIAIELGYASDSAYIYAFKKMFNQTPSKYRTDSLERGLTLSHHSN